MSQTTVLADVPLALEGSVAYPGAGNLTISRWAKTDMPFGRFVTFKTASGAESCDLPTVTGDVTLGRALGIAVFDPAKEPNSALGYKAGQMVQILRRGYIWMLTETDVAEGSAVFVRFATVTGSGTAPAIGKVRKDADTADAVALPGAFFRTTLAAAGLAIVEINLPQ